MAKGINDREMFLMRLRGHGYSLQEIESSGIEPLAKRWTRFETGKIGYPTGVSFDAVVHGIRGLSGLKKRLEAIVGFYETLYKPDPNKKFKVSFKKEHKWPDGTVSHFVVAFECPPRKEIGYTRFSFDVGEGKTVMLFFQGNKGADVHRASKVLGKPWFEAFMNRVLEAYRPLHEAGTQLHMYDADRISKLPKQVRDRYFGRPRGNVSFLYPLNPQRQRVRKVLRL